MISDPPSFPAERELALGAVLLFVGVLYGGFVRGSDETPRRVASRWAS